MVRDRELKLSAVVLAEAERPTREGGEPTPHAYPLWRAARGGCPKGSGVVGRGERQGEFNTGGEADRRGADVE